MYVSSYIKSVVLWTGDTEGDLIIDAIRDAILPPSDEILACQDPKPILLATGEVIINHKEELFFMVAVYNSK